MLKKLLLFCCILMTSVLILSAQSPQPGSFLPKKSAAKGTSISPLIGNARYNYSATTAGYVFEDSNSYFYSNGRFGDLTHPMQYDYAFHIGLMGSNKVADQKFLQTFDANNNITSYTYQYWNNATTSWVNDGRQNMYYDGANRMTRDTILSWNSSSNSWHYTKAGSYTYNAAGKLLTSDYWYFNFPTSTWTAGGQYLLSYDVNNNLTEQLGKARIGSSLVNSERTIYVYNTSNALLGSIDQTWRTVTGSWLNSRNNAYVVNAHGDPDMLTVSYWDSTANAWDSMFRYSYTYNASFLKTADARQHKNLTSLLWENKVRYVYTYNGFDQVTSETTQQWNTGSGLWNVAAFDIQNLYYYGNNPNSITTRNVQGGKKTVFPIPASSELTIQLQWDEPQDCTALIVDMQGRVLQQWHRPSGKQFSETIDITMLPVGNYVLLLNGHKGGVQRASFSVLR